MMSRALDLPKKAENAVASVACTASSAEYCDNHEKACHDVLHETIRAAQHNCILPLPVGFDLASIIAQPWFRRTLHHCESGSMELACRYNTWLRKFANEQKHVLSRTGTGRYRFAACGDGQSTEGDLLALVIYAWESHKTEEYEHPREWIQLCRYILEKPELISKMCTLWAGPRSFNSKIWSRWCAIGPQDNKKTVSRAHIWSRLSTGHSLAFWPELFDHGAGHIYLDSEDISLLADQARRIRKLRARRRNPFSTPFVTSIEHQDPNFGVDPISLYLPDDFDEIAHRKYNHEIALLNAPPKRRDPNVVRVHLCWQFGLGSVGNYDNCLRYVREESQASDSDESSPEQRVNLSRASMLSGFMALVLDDFRCFLQGLPLRFYIRCGSPHPLGCYASRPGRRWKTAIRRARRLPPSRVVTTLFRRPSHVSTALTEPKWRLTDKVDWRVSDCWLLCMHKSDLSCFGFSEHKIGRSKEESEQVCLTAPTKSLPEHTTHLITVDRPDNKGTIYRVSGKTRHSEQVTLRPMVTERPDVEFVPFAPVRYALLDVIIDELQWKLR